MSPQIPRAAILTVAFSLLFVLVAAPASAAEMLSGAALVNALKSGGYVLVMRHASSPMARPDKAHAEPGNSALERQLDAKGKKTAAAMGAALQKLSIPVGEVYSSPTFRAIETVDLAGLPDAITESALDAGTTNMSAAADAARADWLKMQVASLPRMGTDTFIVTHTPNIRAAFGDEATGIGAGEALVFHPDGQGNMPLVARIKITDWPKLAGG